MNGRLEREPEKVYGKHAQHLRDEAKAGNTAAYTLSVVSGNSTHQLVKQTFSGSAIWEALVTWAERRSRYRTQKFHP